MHRARYERRRNRPGLERHGRDARHADQAVCSERDSRQRQRHDRVPGANIGWRIADYRLYGNVQRDGANDEDGDKLFESDHGDRPDERNDVLVRCIRVECLWSGSDVRVVTRNRRHSDSSNVCLGGARQWQCDLFIQRAGV